VASAPPLTLDGTSLRLPGIALASQRTSITIDPAALERMRQIHALAATLAETQPVYGRTTGVGAARHEEAGSPGGHGLRLLRSHAAGWGTPLPTGTVRAALAVRANQVLAGSSGVSPLLAQALVSLAAGDEADLPVVHRHGAVGTGDLTALAQVGLTLIGERPRLGGHRRADLELTSADALPLMSSNAFAIAQAALGVDGLQRLSQSASVVCALSFVALQGNREALSDTAMTATPFPGATQAARAVRALLAEQPGQPAHIQDFFGLRTWPQVHGPLLDSLQQLVEVVQVMANTGCENPLFTAGNGGQVTHHGGFHAAYLALALDSALLALTRSAQAVQSRVSHLLTDAESAPTLFLSDVTPGASGLLIAEYVAASALSLIRGVANAPSSVQTAHLSGGIEDDASFAGHGAGRLGEATAAYRRMLAVELVTAVRAIRMRGMELRGPLRVALDACGVLPSGVEDRDLSAELEAAERIVEGYAALAVDAGRPPHSEQT
jgi:histidine ammonia-lyase